jgi:hypothetical protein
MSPVHVRGRMWDTLAVFITPDIKRVVEFAKRIPCKH